MVTIISLDCQSREDKWRIRAKSHKKNNNNNNNKKSANKIHGQLPINKNQNQTSTADQKSNHSEMTTNYNIANNPTFMAQV